MFYKIFKVVLSTRIACCFTSLRRKSIAWLWQLKSIYIYIYGSLVFFIFCNIQLFIDRRTVSILFRGQFYSFVLFNLIIMPHHSLFLPPPLHTPKNIKWPCIQELFWIKFSKCWLLSPATYFKDININTHIFGFTVWGRWSATMGWNILHLHLLLWVFFIHLAIVCLWGVYEF